MKPKCLRSKRFLGCLSRGKRDIGIGLLLILILGAELAYPRELDIKTMEARVQKIITGMVTDESGVPLPGVTVLVKGTENGTYTDFDGKFTIAADSSDVLVLSYIGYRTQEVLVGQRTDMVIGMEVGSEQLDEIVVVGYGTQKRKDVTGSIASVDTENIGLRPVTSIEQALQGAAPGLNISQRNASPGQTAAITIRGVGSLSAGYEPLWVVDGFPTDQRNAESINPSDIESVDVLKDASSTAIYGSRGANGVIIITTKRAKAGKSTLELDVSSGLASVPESFRLDVLNAKEYVQFMTESYANRGATLPSEIVNWDGVTDTDWQDLVYRTALYSKYNLSSYGGTEKSNYLFSGSYIKQDGVTIGESYEKYSGRLKAETKIGDKLTLGLNMAPNYSIEETSGREWPGGPEFPHVIAALMPPITPVRNADGSYAIGPNGMVNPLESAENFSFQIKRFRMLTNAYAIFELLDGLNLKTNIGSTLNYDNHETYDTPTGVNRDVNDFVYLNVGKFSTIGWLSETTLNYKKLLGNHSIDILSGYTAQKEKNDGVWASVNGFDILGPKIIGFGNAETLNANSVRDASSLISYLGRLNYAYDDKYLLTATFRRDGSSRFGTNSRFANFGSAAIGWRVSKEKFLENAKFLNDLKLRASYGRTGSNSIPNYIAKPSLTSIRHSFGSSQVTGVVNADPGNINLTWETSDQVDMGLDLSMFRNRLTIIGDYYRNTTSGLLLNKQIPLSSGFPSGYLTNIGRMRNWGYEFSLTADIVDNEDWKWTIGGNVTRNWNKVLDLGGADQIQKWYGVLRHVPGREFKEIYGVEVIGVARQGDGSGVAPGDLIFRDVDGDGTIGSFVTADGVPIGSPNQDWAYGITSTLRYGQFTLSTLLQGQAGAQMQDFNLNQIANGANINNVSKKFHYEGRYIDEDHPGNGHVPRAGALVTSAGGVGSVSSIAIQSTDYLRIKNISLSYDFDNELLKVYGINRLRLYGSIENLYTFTNFIGGNPDAVNGSIGPVGPSRLPGISDGREIGINVMASQPLPRIMTIGLNITF